MLLNANLCPNFRNKTVVVSLWNDLATGVGQELLDIADSSPVVAIKSLKVGDYQGSQSFRSVHLYCFDLL